MATLSQTAEKVAVVTHHLIELHSTPPSIYEKAALNITLIVLDVKKLSSHCNSLPLIAKPFSFSSLRCGTLSNAFP